MRIFVVRVVRLAEQNESPFKVLIGSGSNRSQRTSWLMILHYVLDVSWVSECASLSQHDSMLM